MQIMTTFLMKAFYFFYILVVNEILIFAVWKIYQKGFKGDFTSTEI